MDVRFMARLIVVAVAINFIWEMVQMPLYLNMPWDELSSWWFCFRASLGDGVIVLTIWAIGLLLFREGRWFHRLSPLVVTVLLVSGAVIAIVIELHAIATGRWAYSDLMPLLPIVGVGLSPLVQLLVLPFVSMKLAER